MVVPGWSRALRGLAVAAGTLSAGGPGLVGQAAAPDSGRAGRFDLGKMWTFEHAPAEYFTAEYGFTADSAGRGSGPVTP